MNPTRRLSALLSLGALVAFQGCSTDAPLLDDDDLSASSPADVGSLDLADGAKVGLAPPPVEGLDPIGFGIGGIGGVDWRNDGRKWTYNWGYDPTDLATSTGPALYLPMVWGGPFCAKWGDLRSGELQRDVARYKAHVCGDARCTFDDRDVYTDDGGVRREIVIARGRRVDFVAGSDTPSTPARLLTSMDRYCGPKDGAGVCADPERPCFGKKGAECAFDSYAVVKVGAERWESISTASGRYYNVDLATGAARGSALLTSVTRYCGAKAADGTCNDPKRPCFGKKGAECRFDTRAVTATTESITTPGYYFNFERGKDAVQSSGKLSSVERYRWGACLGAVGDTCSLDSRAIVEYPDGSKVESISALQQGTSAGKYFNWDADKPGEFCKPDDPSLTEYLASKDAYIAKHGGAKQRWLIFNEPDVRSQSNMPPEHAAKLYAILHQRIKAKAPEAKLHCCGTSPATCAGPGCGWEERFAAALPAGIAPDAVHYHNYATGDGQPAFFDKDGTHIIAQMKAYSARLQAIPQLANKAIVISEWGGLSDDMQLMCTGTPNNVDGVMLPVAEWLRRYGSGFRFQAAAWFVSYCGEADNPNCTRASILYDGPQGTAHSCGPGCKRTCLGEKFFGQVAGTW